jgi:translation initiation factor IF-1
MTIEIKGTVKEVLPTEVVSEKFSKKVIAVTIDEGSNYPQHIAIEAHDTEKNKKINLLDSVEVHDKVTILANLNGKLYEKQGQPNRYFNTLTIYKITVEQF